MEGGGAQTAEGRWRLCFHFPQLPPCQIRAISLAWGFLGLTLLDSSLACPLSLTPELGTLKAHSKQYQC